MSDEIRNAWVLGLFVQIYSSSKQKWYDGEITDIYIDEETNKVNIFR